MDPKAGRRGVDADEGHLLEEGHPVVEEGRLIVHIHLQQEQPCQFPKSNASLTGLDVARLSRKTIVNGSLMDAIGS